MRTKSLDIILLTFLLGAAVSSFAFSWRQVNGIPSAVAAGMSADGRVICTVSSAGNVSISTDSGNNWKYTINNPFFFRGGEVAISADGSKIFTCLMTNGQIGILKSSDYGKSWTQTSFPSSKYSSNSPVACSADGSIVVTASGIGQILYSANSGANCRTSSVLNANWQSLASSAGGARMAAAAGNGSIYFSTNFGAMWSAANLSTQSWTSVCLSSDGQWVGAISTTNSYISGNAGVSWATNHIGGSNIVCSANGTRWIIAGSQILSSADSGRTWRTNFDSLQLWDAAAISADGSEVFAADWLGNETPSPQLNLRYQGSTVAVSWLLPSTNFVLQQTTDLTGNWSTVPISPALVFTNLQQEITLPVTTGNAFFRLSAQ